MIQFCRMKNIIASVPKNDSLKSQLVALYFTFKQIQEGSPYHFDLTKFSSWIHPLLILPIAAYIKDTNSTFTPPVDEDKNSYLKTIRFPLGATSVPELQKVKNFIPISFLSKNSHLRDRELVESCFGELIYKITGEIAGVKNALFYPISELIANIFQHSKKDEGWLFAQTYPKKKFFDLCIIDRGRGFKKAYAEELGLELSDEKAIEEAMKGVSIKSDHERGYGVHTSKKLVCEGMGGSFIIVSGTSAFIAERQEQKMVKMDNFYWQGVIVAYRIPFPSSPIDIMPYIE